MMKIKSKILENKNFKFLKIVNFYDSQIKVLDDMLKEVNEKSKNSKSTLECDFFQNEFLSKQKMIVDLKKNIINHNYLITKELNQNEDVVLEQLSNQNKSIENNILTFEKDVNELSKDFKLYILNKI